MHVHALHEQSLIFLQHLSFPLVFKLAKRTHPPGTGPQGWGNQYVVQTTHSSGRISKPVLSPLLPGAQMHFFPSYIIPYGYIFRPGCIRVFPTVFSLFAVRIAPHADVFLMCSVGGGELHTLLLCHPDLLHSTVFLLLYLSDEFKGKAEGRE